MLLCLVTGIVLLTIRCCPQVEGRSVSKMSEIKDVLDFFTDTYAESSTVCHANGVNYTEGKQMTIPNKYDNIEDATCQHCLCASGKPSGCRSIHCDLGKGRSWCEKYGSVPRGECCPKCECLHNGQRMSEGSSWTIRRSDGRCAECKCVEGRGNCKLKSVLCPVCEKPIPADDQCCDICPKPTTTTPTVITFILPTTKARSIFTFPPRPRGLRRNLVRYGDLNIE